MGNCLASLVRKFYEIICLKRIACLGTAAAFNEGPKVGPILHYLYQHGRPYCSRADKIWERAIREFLLFGIFNFGISCTNVRAKLRISVLKLGLVWVGSHFRLHCVALIFLS